MSYRCKKCGQRSIFLERGKYWRNLICDSTTGKFMDYESEEHKPDVLCCGECDSTEIEIVETSES